MTLAAFETPRRGYATGAEGSEARSFFIKEQVVEVGIRPTVL
jgi:hypothetical protein